MGYLGVDEPLPIVDLGLVKSTTSSGWPFEILVVPYPGVFLVVLCALGPTYILDSTVKEGLGGRYTL